MRDIKLRGCHVSGPSQGHKQGVTRKAHGQVQMAGGGGRCEGGYSRDYMSVNR